MPNKISKKKLQKNHKNILKPVDQSINHVLVSNRDFKDISVAIMYMKIHPKCYKITIPLFVIYYKNKFTLPLLYHKQNQMRFAKTGYLNGSNKTIHFLLSRRPIKCTGYINRHHLVG